MMSTQQFRVVSGDTQIIFARTAFTQGSQNEDNTVSFQWPFADSDVVVTATLADPGWGDSTPTSGIGTRNITADDFSALIKSVNTGYSSEFSWIAMGTVKN